MTTMAAAGPTQLGPFFQRLTCSVFFGRGPSGSSSVSEGVPLKVEPDVTIAETEHQLAEGLGSPERATAALVPMAPGQLSNPRYSGWCMQCGAFSQHG